MDTPQDTKPNQKPMVGLHDQRRFVGDVGLGLRADLDRRRERLALVGGRCHHHAPCLIREVAPRGVDTPADLVDGDGHLLVDEPGRSGVQQHGGPKVAPPSWEVAMRTCLGLDPGARGAW